MVMKVGAQKNINSTNLSESKLQADVVSWCRIHAMTDHRLKNLYSIPNGAVIGGKNRFALINKLKAEGLEPGVADLCLAWPCGPYHGLYIEMKRMGEKQSPKQIQWQKQLTEAGYLYCLCFSNVDAINQIKNYLALI